MHGVGEFGKDLGGISLHLQLMLRFISRKVRIFDKPQFSDMVCSYLMHGVDIVATCM
jgi:hypothetical protein